jgi:MazG C-terminal domain
MYFEGRPLGDDLTDQTSEDDGYRFHDVMHLALVAHLGWSPVTRGFMRRKRPDVDEVEDAGRAKVVEELVLKAIHSEGERQSRAIGRCQVDGPTRLFPVRSTIPFSLLKTVRGWVQGLEAWRNTYWEWEDAIYTGCEIFSLLRAHKQGTVQVDLLNRRATFKPVVSANVSGATVGLGMASLRESEAESILANEELGRARAISRVADTGAAKKALLQALGLPLTSWDQLDIDLLPESQISVKASGDAQDRIWAMGVIDFKVAFAVANEESMLCSAMAIADFGSQGK